MCKEKQKLSLMQVINRFSDDETAEQWFIDQRWGNGVICEHCNSDRVGNKTTARGKRGFRCKDCRKSFTVKTNSVMASSNLGYRIWAIAIFLLTTNIKGIASTKLASELDITQKTAWHLAHRIREVYSGKSLSLEGEVEIDETYIGGKEKNKHGNKKIRAGRGAVGKKAVIGMRQRGGKSIAAMPIENTDKTAMQSTIHDHVKTGSTIYTDEHRGYIGLDGVFYDHKSVKHSVGEYVNGQAHTNGIERFWALLKRGYHGTYHHMSTKHLTRCVDEFSTRFGIRDVDTMDAMQILAISMFGKRLPYAQLTKA